MPMNASLVESPQKHRTAIPVGDAAKAFVMRKETPRGNEHPAVRADLAAIHSDHAGHRDPGSLGHAAVQVPSGQRRLEDVSVVFLAVRVVVSGSPPNVGRRHQIGNEFIERDGTFDVSEEVAAAGHPAWMTHRV